jgi:hypothetical protein
MKPLTSRKTAKELGIKRYFTGKPCKHGHIGERLVSTKACLECDQLRLEKWKSENVDKLREYHEQFYQSNKRQILESQKAYRKQNPDVAKRYHQRASETRNARSRQWREQNKERVVKRYAEYAQNNKPTLTAREAKRRAAKQRATPSWAHDEKTKAIYIEAKRLQDLDGIKRHVDHIVPLRGKNVCGLHVHYNLQILTSQENLRKGAKHDGFA